jgi:hypothetical protein
VAAGFGAPLAGGSIAGDGVTPVGAARPVSASGALASGAGAGTGSVFAGVVSALGGVAAPGDAGAV